jgi:hypothetical protein
MDFARGELSDYLQYVDILVEGLSVRGYESWCFEEILGVSEDGTKLLFRGTRPDGMRTYGYLYLGASLKTLQAPQGASASK